MSAAAVASEPVKTGIYRHFKGGMYLAIGVSENEKTKVRQVNYVDLKTQKEYSRDESEWFDKQSNGALRFTLMTEVKYPRKTDKGWVIN